MRDFEIIPLERVGPIMLGMARKDVHTVFGPPEHSHSGRECFLGGFMVDFDENGRVEFIELAKSTSFRAAFKGRCLHEISADEAVAHVTKYAQCDSNSHELGRRFIFLDLQLSLWRATLPDENQPADDPSGRYFEAVGIAKESYFLPGR